MPLLEGKKSVERKPDAIDGLIIWIGSVPSLIFHTGVFVVFFTLAIVGVMSWDIMLLVLTTIVSLEAIYLAIFIQMTVNRHTESLREVEADVDEIQEDIGEIQEDVDEIQEDVDELQEDFEEMSEDERENERKRLQAVTLEALTTDIRRVLTDLEDIKKRF